MARMTRSQSRELETPSDQDTEKRNSGPKKASVNREYLLFSTLCCTMFCLVELHLPGPPDAVEL